MEKKRLAFVDYGKALAIIFVLMDHLRVRFFADYVLFTLPLFFIASGYTFNLKDTTFNEFAMRRIKRLLLPFWCFMLLDIPLEITRAYFLGYGTYKLAIPILLNTIYGSGAKVPALFGLRHIIDQCFSYKTQGLFLDIILSTNCHLWFLPAMFVASILFFPIIKRFRNNNFALCSFSILLILIAAFESFDTVPQFPYCIGRGCIGAAYMLFGYKLKELSFFEKCSASTKTVVLITTSIIALSFIKFLGINGHGMIRSIYGSYGIWSAYLAFLGGVFATVAVLTSCNLLEQFNIGVFGRALSNIGENTMALYLWQFFGFSVLDILYLKIFRLNPTPDKYWQCILPQSALWYKFVEAIIFISFILLVEKFIKQKKIA